MNKSASAFAPASIGNLGVGFDMLGLALAGVGDTVIAHHVDEPGISITEVRDQDGNLHAKLSAHPEENTASIAAEALWTAEERQGGVALEVHKGVALQSGMGSSAASAVAAVAAVNLLLDEPLTTAELLPFAIQGEKFASGGAHADNVAPSLIGGLVLCPTVLLPLTVSVNTPAGISCVLLHPEMEVNTAQSRLTLATSYSMQQWLAQQGYLSGFIAACEQNDHKLMRRCLRDVVIEPQRAASVPCFGNVKRAAMDNGAFGCSLSGSGPSIFALCEDEHAHGIASAMEQACLELRYECQSWVSPLDAPGATASVLE